MKPVVLFMISVVLFGVLVDAIHFGQNRPNHHPQHSPFVRNNGCSRVCDLNKGGRKCGLGCTCTPSTTGARGLGICRPSSRTSPHGNYPPRSDLQKLH
uniref:Putative secreted protein n=1 Tax=Amblyomma triste TaxID=251400 RepID=A0A023G0B4_AMBTT